MSSHPTLESRQSIWQGEEAERAMAKRSGAESIAINNSPVAMMSHPGVVTKVILKVAAH